MARLVDYLTPPGTGALRKWGVLPKKPVIPPPPPPPAAPPPAPTMADAEEVRVVADARRRQQALRRGVSGTIRNVGGGKGIPTSGPVRNVGGARGGGMDVAETARALKSLTGM